MFDELYTSQILERAARIPAAKRLDAPDASAHKRSRLCGSEMTVDLKLSDGKISDFGLDAKACALGQCAAAILAEHIVGSTPAELRGLRDRMRAMLKEGGPPPAGKWADLALLQPVKDYPARHASTLLAFEAAAAALDALETGAATA